MQKNYIAIGGIGMNNDEILTIKAALLYILNRIPDNKRSIYFIVKTAFYAHEKHLAKWAAPLFDDDICALPFGPVPSMIYDILKGARGDKKLYDVRLQEVAKTIRCNNEEFFATEEPDMGWLSVAAVECLDAAIAEISTKSFNDVYDTTHESEEYKRARKTFGKRIMNPVQIAKAAGAEEGVLEYLEEYLQIKAALA